MGKLSGGYESVVRGVSEQAPQNRRSGQHFAQVNMISDPVRGLARRHGSLLQDEVKLSIPATQFDSLLADTQAHKTFPFYVGDDEFDVILRTTPDAASLGQDGFAWCFNKSAREFIPIVYNANDIALNQLVSGGVSAVVNVGRYLYMAGNDVVPKVATVDVWNNLANRGRIAATIQLGAYSRTFSLTLVRPDGSKVIGSYTTPSSSYGGTLDTSDIPLYQPDGTTLNPTYQKQVNDRVNAYNGEVTKWIGTAAAAITPANIAAMIAADLRSKGVPSASNIGGTVILDDPQFNDASGSDGGDGSLIRAVGGDVDNVDLVNTVHWVGKVVRVPSETTTGNAVYLKAVSREGGGSGWGPVIWRETAGFSITPQIAFIMGTVEDGKLYIASTAAGLTALSGVVVPDYKANSVGDDLSSPVPEFFGRRIDFLAVFQDRLVIGSGATLLFSRPGDYLNWFRKSVTTVADDDPWEGFALGTEDDTIKWSTLYDRNLLLFGKRFQYIVSGRQPFTPKSASIIVSTAFEDAIDAEPKATGNFVIYGKYNGRLGSEVSSVHQVQAGSIADTPESYKISQQLDTYLAGIPVEIVTMTAPNMILLRTRTERQRVFTYSYMDDAQQGRLFDSWSHWEWADHVGCLIGLSRDSGDVLIYTLKKGITASGASAIWVAAERMVRDTALSDYPYLDSLRPLSQYQTDSANSYLNPTYGPKAGVAVALERLSDKQFIGLPMESYADFLAQYPTQQASAWVGASYPAYVTPTNPYAKDRNGQSILTGRLTLSSVKVAVSETGGMEGWVTRSTGAANRVLDFTGRYLASPTNIIGKQPIVSTTLSVIVGGEVRECSYTLRAKTWLPLTITSIDWTGQLFLNTRRA
ncbi:tail tubular protein B [Sphingomonas phage Scott]|uniref:Tail tubular protein B n=1 Tax=Sphingomonas phage Scott TaxID=2282912 RepID=A0A346FDC5_9CAUD|nr:tail protein [Sphingomonas phage Scott]AXN53739.1 tail tubular protein B [Sphingomonas phage Scott]